MPDRRGRAGSTVAAFANTAGGTILIGVEDKTRHVRRAIDPWSLEEQATASPQTPEGAIHGRQCPDASPSLRNAFRVAWAISLALCRSNTISDRVNIRGAGEIPSLRLSLAVEGVIEADTPAFPEIPSGLSSEFMRLPGMARLDVGFRAMLTTMSWPDAATLIQAQNTPDQSRDACRSCGSAGCSAPTTDVSIIYLVM